MFEYDGKIFRLWGFINISYIDNSRVILKYKNRDIDITGNNLQVINLIDNSLEIKGVIDSIKVEYCHD